MACLRASGFPSVKYLDDILCLGFSCNNCQENTKATVDLLTRLGFVINYNKSNLNPQKSCQFLGFILDYPSMTLQLPYSKREKLSQFVDTIIKTKRMCIREFSRFVGSITAACPAIDYGWLHTKSLERAKYLALLKNNDNYDAYLNLPDNLQEDLHWWKNNLLVAVNPIRQQNFNLEIYTDASTSGWGAACGSETTGGFWSSSERSSHINCLELLAIYFGLKSFANNKKNCDILVRVDNTTAISYVNRMGGVQYPHLNSIAKKIWNWCEERKIHIFASYIRSSLNVEADRESRNLNVDTEWELGSREFNNITLNFGVPSIDLFASRTNTKCPLYMSWKRDPFAYNIDAFTLDWSKFFFYAFPPFALILKTLNKIVFDKATGIVVVPHWPSQPWYPLFRSLCVEKILIFPPSKNLLTSPFRSTHPLHRHLSLAACVLSGKDSGDNQYQNRL